MQVNKISAFNQQNKPKSYNPCFERITVDDSVENKVVNLLAHSKNWQEIGKKYDIHVEQKYGYFGNNEIVSLFITRLNEKKSQLKGLRKLFAPRTKGETYRMSVFPPSLIEQLKETSVESIEKFISEEDAQKLKSSFTKKRRMVGERKLEQQ